MCKIKEDNDILVWFLLAFNIGPTIYTMQCRIPYILALFVPIFFKRLKSCEIVLCKIRGFLLFVCMLQSERKAVPLIPVTWSTRMREVIIRPYWEKSCSSSFWVMVLGSPLTYRLASRIEAELGRAYDTCKTKNTLRIHCSYETIVV